MKSRRTNKPVKHLFDKKQQIESRQFDTKKHEVIDYVSLGIISIMWGRLTGFFGSLSDHLFGSWSINSSISNLDLRSNSPRGHGAVWLRQTWPKLGSMVSTRDGKRV